MTPEPSKEDLEKAHKLVTDYFCFHEKDLMRNGESNDYWIQKQTQDIAQALAELRAEGERKYQSVKDEYVCELNKTQNEWEAEKSALEERVRQLEAHKPDYSDPRYETLNDRIRENRELSEINKRQKEEIARLKSRNAELEAKLRMTDDSYVALKMERDCLKAENEGLKSEAGYHDAKDTISALESTVSALTKEVCDNKETIDRLSASLAAVYKKLNDCVVHFENTPPSKPRPTLSELEEILKRDQVCLTQIQVDGSLTSHPCIEEAKKLLSDPTGKEAFERWKKMEAVVEEAKKWRSKKYLCDRGYTFWVEFQYQERDLEKALEALDAKGASDV